MPVILLHTFIQAPPEICFDLSRSVDLHLLSTAATGEEAVAGKTSGLMELNDTVTWKARHLGIRQKLTSRITDYEFPKRFVSEMQKGAFKRIHHHHIFAKQGEGTLMTDVFDFEAPFGMIGRWACTLFLTEYMKDFLEKRNLEIKKTGEGQAIFLSI